MTEEQVVELLGPPDSTSNDFTDITATAGTRAKYRCLHYQLKGLLFSSCIAFGPMEVMIQEGKVAKVLQLIG